MGGVQPVWRVESLRFVLSNAPGVGGGGNAGGADNPRTRAYNVSYNRPVRAAISPGRTPSQPVLQRRYPMIRWLERNGYDVSYFTGSRQRPPRRQLHEPQDLLSVGHDAYWSAAQRANVEAARDAGVNLAFLGGARPCGRRVPDRARRRQPPESHAGLLPRNDVRRQARSGARPWTGTWRDSR